MSTSADTALDSDVQQAAEQHMGDSFSDVQIHTGPQAAKACEDINARAFTVGNHIAFNHGEYDPESPEGQHTIVHELAHVRQQTGGHVSTLPKQDAALEIDPDEGLERDAEQTAQRVMKSWRLGIRSDDHSRSPAGGQTRADYHVQRVPKGKGLEALAVFIGEQDDETIGNFRNEQNERRENFMTGQLDGADNTLQEMRELKEKREEKQEKREEERSQLRQAIHEGRGYDIGDEGQDIDGDIANLEESVEDDLEQIGMTEDQRDMVTGGSHTVWDNVGWWGATTLIGLIPGGGTIATLISFIEATTDFEGPDLWNDTSGDLDDRFKQIRDQLAEGTHYGEEDTGSGSSQGVGSSRR